MKELWHAMRERIARFWGGLTHPQRTLSIVVAGAVVLAIILLSLRDGAPPASEVEATALAQASSRLEHWNDEVEASGSGAVSWLFEANSWLETPGKFDAKLLHSKTRIVEEAILWNAKIQKARIVLEREPRGRYARERDGEDTAAVMLWLRAGEHRLDRDHVSAVLRTIENGFGVPQENVSISVTDAGGATYDATPSLAGGADDALREDVREQVADFLRAMYDDSDFVVLVSVRRSRRTSRLETEAYDPARSVRVPRSSTYEREEGPVAGGLGPVPTIDGRRLDFAEPAGTGRRRVFETVEEDVLAGRSREITEVPAGEIEGLRVNVLLDLRAVENTLGGPGTVEPEIAAYERSLESYLQSLYEDYPNSRVTVLARRFTAASADLELAGTGGASAPARDARSVVDRAMLAAGVSWLRRWWPALAGGATLALATALFAATILTRPRRGAARRRLAAASAGERRNGGLRRGVEDTLGVFALHPGERGVAARFDGDRGRTSGGGGESGLAGAEGGGVELAAGVIESLDDTSRLVRERPESAAAVLRLWLAETTPTVEPEQAR